MIKKKKDIDAIRISGKILARVLSALKEKVAPGVRLSDLDLYARELLKKENARPVFLNYQPEGADKPYPAAICTSVNEKIVHGVPNAYVVREGDLVKIDIGVEYGGYIADAAVTAGAGTISRIAKKLMDVTERSLYCGIEECVPGNTLGDVGNAIESVVHKGKFSVIRGLTGHGVGFELHEEPTVYNFGKSGTGMKLREGMVLAIEPMVSTGSPDIIQLSDESYATSDGSLSAHFEHTVAITKNGPEILTRFIV